MVRWTGLFLLLASAAMGAPIAPATFMVSSWGRGGSRVMTYSIDGAPQGMKDFGTLDPKGAHPWDKERDLVQIGNAWVDHGDLAGVGCGVSAPPTTAPLKIRPPSGQAQAPSTGFASGTSC